MKEEYKYTNYFAKDRIILGEKAPLDWPLAIYVEPSGFCNLKCKFCTQSLQGPRAMNKKNMELSLFKKLIDELDAEQVHIPMMRFAGMGEPTLNPNYVEMLNYAYKLKLQRGGRFQMATNGTLLTHELSEEITKYLDSIILSVEGLSGEDYLKICSVEVDFDKLLDEVRFLYGHKRKCEIIVKIPSIMVKEREREEKYYQIFKGFADKVNVEQISDMWPDFQSDLIDINSKKFRFSLDGYDWGSSIPHSICPQIFKAIQIYANGDCTPCCFDWERKHNIGNLYGQSLKEIWHGEKLKRIQKLHLNYLKETFEPCKNCSANDFAEVDRLENYRSEILERMG